MSAPLAFELWSDPMVLHLCRHMRRWDQREIFCQRADDDPWSLYRDLASLGHAHLWFEIARPVSSIHPVALFGVVQAGPGIGGAHMFATDDLTLGHARQIADRIQARVIPAMIDHGLHRVEALSLSNYHWAHRFLRRAGAHSEGQRRAMGRDGEDFTAFVWLTPEYQPAIF
ncbi:hypothetical protein [Oceaniglobus trochenteri]|uniref:hypothetical protein n=1 Tax=Oceaniglobus trochenteri TaxID=2763260 RepID=UPI001CFF9A73|nr:hypothetical protein [Oceaniglobus trochenteri]